MFFYPGGFVAFDGTQNNGIYTVPSDLKPASPDFLVAFATPATISFRTGDGYYRADFNYEKFRRIILYANATPRGTVYTLTRDNETSIGEEGSILSRGDLGDPWIDFYWPMCDISVPYRYECEDILWAFDNVPSSYDNNIELV
jgi:hypothetical protein